MSRIFAILACVCAIAWGIGAPGHSIAAAQSGGSAPVEIAGRCIYSDRFAPLVEQGHVFVECDRLVVRREGGQVELTFSHPARLREIRLRGTYSEADRVAVASILLRSRRQWDKAEGDCEFEQRDSGDPAAVCVIRSGARFYVVNFEPDE